MATTDLTTYQPRIDALCRTTEGRVSVTLNIWYGRREPDVEWTVYLARGSDTGTKMFEGGTLEQALANAERACDVGPAPMPTLVLGVPVTPAELDRISRDGP
jgi:hypothetical protein